MKRIKSLLTLVLLVLILVALIVNAVTVLRFMRAKASRPCLAIPMRSILDYPECAEKLVDAANVSGVRVVSNITLISAQVGT